MVEKAQEEAEKIEKLTAIEFHEVALECKSMKRKFKSASTQGHSKQKEVCKTKSLTVPDQTLTVRELLSRSAMGMLDDYQLDYDYSMDDDDFRGLDPVEMFNMSQDSAELVKRETAKREKAEKMKADKKLKDEIIEEYKKSQDAGE